MAGSYPNVPSRRFALDADGTLGGSRFANDTQALVEFTPGEMVTLQQEDLAVVTIGGGSQPDEYAFLIFPELREFDGLYIGSGLANIISEIHTSGDTTNTFDGTWTQRIANYDDSVPVSLTTYRTEITSTAVSNVRGIRLVYDATGGSKRLSGWHIYGEISAGETPDRLLWVDEITGLEFTLPIDYGDVPRGSARDRGTRLKNNSGSLTANTLQISAEDLVGGSGDWYTFDVAGGGFVSTNSDITSLGSGASSGLITIRQNVPDSEDLGLHSGRAFVNVASWS